MATADRDAVDRVTAQWAAVRPDLDSSPIGVVGRVSRLALLVDRGLVERAAAPDDRRKVVVRLTPAGVALVDEVAPGHLDTERALLAALTPRQQADLARLLRTVLADLGDRPPA